MSKETSRSIFFTISFAEIIKIKVKYYLIYLIINFYISVLLISQFNGLDIIIQRIDETLRRGLPTKADDKSATTDILESSIATLRILAKGKG